MLDYKGPLGKSSKLLVQLQ